MSPTVLVRDSDERMRPKLKCFWSTDIDDLHTFARSSSSRTNDGGGDGGGSGSGRMDGGGGEVAIACAELTIDCEGGDCGDDGRGEP